TPGRTGSCCEAIIRSGIRRVVYGATDPNPAHAGRALAVLRDAGVEVVPGVLADDCADLNLIFNHWITAGAPLIAGKIATTLDGKIATRAGRSRWITSEAARADVHHWRRLFPAIAVGAMTALKDNPRLTARQPAPGGGLSQPDLFFPSAADAAADAPVVCPRRFVFDGLLRTASALDSLHLYNDAFRERTTVVTTTRCGDGYVRKFREKGVQVWMLEAAGARVDFSDFRRRCAEEGVTGVYVEGGGILLGELLRARQLDYLFAYTAPLIFADDRSTPALSGLQPATPDQAPRLAGVRHSVHGADILTRGPLAYPAEV
ncbi:MAG: bifunctional diaminohydroxyphosphoribosylaminopyrimidine deaminase/5-amino-6-(5-phosphoribosylamino)uracil reductase RibD, partial [Opitutaceae bacterium]|nr:bifunctional diaminohydroxyphosphoribosylaminopyrimidine deaminase/5-amino-6-(5-phosphoribosylamino)uracil reductase RibD [Opitutaceae bacterium]